MRLSVMWHTFIRMASRTPSERLRGEIRAELARQQLTVIDLAARSGISVSTLRRRMGGHSGFTMAEVHTIAGVLGVDVVDLIERSRETAVA